MCKATRQHGTRLIIGAIFFGVASAAGAQTESATSSVASTATHDKVKTSDKHQQQVLDFVKGREAPPSTSEPTGGKPDDVVAVPEHLTNSENQAPRASETKVAGGRYATLSPDADIMQLLMIVMMQSTKAANEDLRSMMERIRRLNRERQEVRESLTVMWQEQARLRADPDLKAEQLEWADSLNRHCPPGTDDNCLVEQLRTRAAVLKTRPQSAHCTSAKRCGGPTLSVSEDPDAGGEASPPTE